ncbi:hypothetical protein J8273_5794 [Carpediemonas membranifera]|uniref:Uncharacterized protein n=1 Tax=Carpediemonas membranifera TaxID=201153 RepID=A0A8J6E1B8_9EUKA|nr:hypothetical protein J8273_5794 [Carpediemonas membranifera]|eukprot:KAG9392861.1 hypothetical protein J8273_5794 [Carpediemonas membranifera]
MSSTPTRNVRRGFTADDSRRERGISLQSLRKMKRSEVLELSAQSSAERILPAEEITKDYLIYMLGHINTCEEAEIIRMLAVLEYNFLHSPSLVDTGVEKGAIPVLSALPVSHGTNVAPHALSALNALLLNASIITGDPSVGKAVEAILHEAMGIRHYSLARQAAACLANMIRVLRHFQIAPTTVHDAVTLISAYPSHTDAAIALLAMITGIDGQATLFPSVLVGPVVEALCRVFKSLIANPTAKNLHQPAHSGVLLLMTCTSAMSADDIGVLGPDLIDLVATVATLAPQAITARALAVLGNIAIMGEGPARQLAQQHRARVVIQATLYAQVPEPVQVRSIWLMAQLIGRLPAFAEEMHGARMLAVIPDALVITRQRVTAEVFWLLTTMAAVADLSVIQDVVDDTVIARAVFVLRPEIRASDLQELCLGFLAKLFDRDTQFLTLFERCDGRGAVDALARAGAGKIQGSAASFRDMYLSA